MAGVILRIVDQEATATHPHFRPQLEGIGYGFLIPVFFVSSGVEFNLPALLSSAATILASRAGRFWQTQREFR